MKKTIVIATILAISASSLTSCATSASIQDNEQQVASYTLKNKKELMKQKIASKRAKVVLATP
ncbi:MAG: hypothetical protein K0U54_01790 [Bacteroidetes bacterium]|nr:hypothetical protein [Bacteroidota bacterium]